MLSQCEDVARRSAQKKGLIGGEADDGADSMGTDAAGGKSAKAGSLSAGGTPGSKHSALTQLTEIADFFRKTEPHSPVTFLIQQAVRWANTPLDQWLAEVIKDESSLSRIREMLGIRLQA